MRVTFGQAKSTERAKVRKQLEDYCALDTMGMVEIVDALGRLSN